MIEAALREALADALGASVTQAAPVHGGDINAAFQVDLADGERVFVKTRAAPAGFFAAEAHGLEYLRAAGALRVPAVRAVRDVPGPGFLALEWLGEGVPGDAYDYAPVAGLKELRQAVADMYNRRFRRGMASQYTWENVAICGGGRLAGAGPGMADGAGRGLPHVPREPRVLGEPPGR